MTRTTWDTDSYFDAAPAQRLTAPSRELKVSAGITTADGETHLRSLTVQCQAGKAYKAELVLTDEGPAINVEEVDPDGAPQKLAP